MERWNLRFAAPCLVVVLCLVMAMALAAHAGTVILDLPAIDRDELLARDKALDVGGPLRFAAPWSLSLTPADDDGWERLPDGSHRWRLEVRAPGALSLGFGFGRFRLPWGAELRIVGERGPERVFTSADNHGHGQLWTPVVLGEVARVILTLPAGHRDDHELELVSVGRGYRFFGEPGHDKQGWCNIDVVCPEGDDWRAEIRSVGVYQVDNIWICTGVMINNTAQDQAPLFLTANHCRVDANNAETVVVYWNFESPVCGDLAGGSLEDTQSGAVWRASWPTTDMTLIEFVSPPDTSWHVTYAGWSRSTTAPDAVVAIHHPSTDEKAISFEDDRLESTAYLDDEADPSADHWRVVDWDLGTTEPGSSGSPLFDPEHRIIGQLHGGYAACGNDLSDWYGRFDISWVGGGEPENQLAHWLDADQTDVMSLEILDPLAPEEPEDPEDPEDPPSMVSLAVLGNPTLAAPVQFVFTLPEPGHVTLVVYDLAGREMARLLDNMYPAGTHPTTWSAVGVAAGAYIVKLEALGEAHTTTITWLR